MIHIQAELIIKPEQVANFLAEVTETISKSREEAGNLRYDLMQSIEDQARFTMIETWKDQEAITQHQNSLHYQEFNQKASQWVATAPEINLFQKLN